MITRLIEIPGLSSKMRIEDITPEVKKLEYTTPVIEFTGFITAYSALILDSMEIYELPDGLDSITTEIIRMDAMGEIKRSVEDLLTK